MKKNAKKLMTGFLVVLMMVTLLVPTVFAAGLEDGEYTISVQAINASTGAPSQADASIKKPVKLVVKDGKINVILTMSSGSMTELALQNSGGSFDAAKILEENKGAAETTYSFDVATIDEVVVLQTTVAAMGRAVSFNLAFDKGSLTATAKATEAAEAPTAPKAEATNVPAPKEAAAVANPKTGDAFTSNLVLVFLMAIAATAATMAYYQLRGKKATN